MNELVGSYEIPSTPDPLWDYYDTWMILLNAQSDINLLIKELSNYENSTLDQDILLAYKLDKIGLALRAKAGDLSLGNDDLIEELLIEY
jgi:hypothetical protein